MKEIPFTIIIPAYNAESYLERSVESVTGQNYDNYKIIIIDDGSSDNTAAVAAKLADNNSKIKVLRQRNSGQLISRSNGVNYAVGHNDEENFYFLFLDADDAFKQGAFSEISKLISENNCDILVFDADRTDSVTGAVSRTMGGNAEGIVNSRSELFKILLFDYRYNSLCRKAVSSHLVTNDKYDEFISLRHAEDLIQSLGFFSKADTALFVKKSFYTYYHNPSSVTNRVSVENYPVESTARAYSWDFIKSQNIWTKQELDEYAAFLLKLLENKIIVVSNLKGTIQQKTALFDKMKRDSFYAELLTMDLKHSVIIKLFIKESYSLMTRVAKLKYFTNRLMPKNREH